MPELVKAYRHTKLYENPERLKPNMLNDCRYVLYLRVEEIKGTLELLQRRRNTCEASHYDYYEARAHFWKREHNLLLLECERQINELQVELKTIENLLREPIETERDRKQRLVEIGQKALEVLKNGD